MAEEKYINKVDGQYNELVAEILRDGEWQINRTGIRRLGVFDRQIRVDLSDGFPMITSRRIPFKSTLVELEFFIKGLTSKQWLKDRNCHYWDFWANPQKVEELLKTTKWDCNYHGGPPSPHESKEKIDEELRKQISEQEDDLGPIYGFQWRNFGESYNTDQYDSCDFYDYHNGVIKGVDQLAYIVDNLRKQHDNNRLICSAWNPNHLKIAALPSCHYLWSVNIFKGRLNLKYHMRSTDLCAGWPQNCTSYAVLLLLLAREAKLEPGILTADLDHVHIYENHIDQITEQITRPTFSLPKIEFEEYGDIFSWSYDKCKLVDYQAGEKIKYEVAV